jgi:hypothetical protein
MHLSKILCRAFTSKAVSLLHHKQADRHGIPSFSFDHDDDPLSWCIFPVPQAVSESVVRDLVSLVGKGNVSTNRQILFNHGKDEGHFP